MTPGGALFLTLMKSEICHHCGCREAEPRRRTLSNGAVVVKRQCVACFGPVGDFLTKSAFDLNRLSSWQDPPFKVQGADHAIVNNDTPNKFWENYAEYLSSDEWARKRSLVLSRSNGMCEGCGTEAAFHVHHLSYRNVGNEFLWELRAVCFACHARIHPRLAEQAVS